ncbi:MAG: hypothetical protein NXY59_06680 [Aigarchaeota archaeon]|nr:hypothetical protein [Candidatus Pelearchaeum maunauluense]
MVNEDSPGVILSPLPRVLIYLGLAMMLVSFFLFYAGHMIRLYPGREAFLITSLIGFQAVVIGRFVHAKPMERILLAVAGASFAAATISLLRYPTFSFGRWDYFIFMTLLFLAFITAGLLPVWKVRPQDYGIAGAFIVSFFFEMFGFPLSLYLINTLFGAGLPIEGRIGLEKAHLWVTLGITDSVTAHFLSALIISVGVALLVIGHTTLYSGRGRVVNWGIYRYMKHPQYTGIVMITGGMLIEYPTIPAFVMWLALTLMYVVKARRETRELLARA